jgi:hypothetical protein
VLFPILVLDVRSRLAVCGWHHCPLDRKPGTAHQARRSNTTRGLSSRGRSGWASQTQRVLAQRPQNFIAFARNKRPRAGGLSRGRPASLARLSPGFGVWALNVGSTGSESANRGFVPGQKVAASGEQCCTDREADISAALVQDKPALSDRVV